MQGHDVKMKKNELNLYDTQLNGTGLMFQQQKIMEFRFSFKTRLNFNNSQSVTDTSARFMKSLPIHYGQYWLDMEMKSIRWNYSTVLN